MVSDSGPRRWRLLAAIIYADRTGESAQVPNEKVFGLIAKADWDLHKAVVGLDEVQVNSRLPATLMRES